VYNNINKEVGSTCTYSHIIKAFNP